MMRKQKIFRGPLALIVALVLVAAACGSDDSTLANGGGEDTGGISQGDEGVDDDGDVADGSDPVGGDDPVSSPNLGWERIEVDPDVTNYDLGVVDHAVADPADDSTLLVRFNMGSTPCAAARVAVEESDTEVVVTVETGLHKNVAAMTCLAGVQGYEMAVSLDAPLADRAVAYNDPQFVDDGPGASVDTTQFVGLDFDDATALAEEQGLVWRIAREDGESFALTEDFNPNRLNLEIDAGVVTAVENW